MAQDHWIDGFNFNVEAWDDAGLHFETLAICRSLALARAAFEAAIADNPDRKLTIRMRTHVVKRWPEVER